MPRNASADRSLKLGELIETEISLASRDTVLSVEYYDQGDQCTETFIVPRENFYSAMGLYNRSTFVEFVGKLDQAIAAWKKEYYGCDSETDLVRNGDDEL
ncbi:hypothetical protein ACFVVC_01775 [Pseudarthrobacter sp. NPDC058196]|uniref:hypothetical protein n=1 Tax=Pseudarthrobacter sp. NPDC058196 TaxID=3346376 RepID=UPI0036DF9DA1